MPTVGHEQSAGHQHPGGEGTEVIDLREELLTVGNIRHDQVYRSGSDPSDLCDHLEATAVDPDLAISWPLDLPSSGRFQLLFSPHSSLCKPQAPVPSGCLIPKDLESLLRPFRLLGGVGHDPGHTTVLPVLAPKCIQLRNLRSCYQFLTDRSDGLVGGAENLCEPVVGQVGGPLQLGCDEFSHLLLVQAASHKIQDVGVITLFLLGEPGKGQHRVIGHPEFVARPYPLEPVDDVAVLVLDDGQDHLPASDGFFESVVLPRGQVWQKVGRDRHGCLRSRSWSKDGQSTNGRRSLGREPILLPSNLCLFWSQASTSCRWPPRSVP